MMKFPKTNSLRCQIFFFSGIMTCVLIVLLGISLKKSFKLYEISEDYVLKNEITNHLNTATIWQAVERGYGATIIGSGEGDSAPFFTNFLEAATKGDAEVIQADKKMKILLSTRKNEAFENKIYSWLLGYGDLIDARPRIVHKNISKYEWLEIATHNINNEFDLRNITFTPQTIDEKILCLNNVLLPKITELCEYAGLERALISNAIASGESISNETMNSIKHYRSIVKQSIVQIQLLKELPSTSFRMKQAIEKFDKEFNQEYQYIREEIFSFSERHEEEVNNAKEQMAKRNLVWQNYLSRISGELLDISKHEDVLALAKDLMAEEGIHLSERLSAVEDMFNALSQVKREYVQIKFLDHLGYERVRVGNAGDTSKIIPGSQLQDKSDRYNFKEILNLSPGEIDASVLFFNMEHGSIENPRKPVIRFTTPVFVDGKRGGIIVFNIPVSNQFPLHKETDNEEKEDYILCTQKGFYLHHPVGTKESGMAELLNESPHNIRQDYPDAAEEILSGRGGSIHLVSGSTIVYEPVFLNYGSNTDNFWVIIKQIKGVEYPISALSWFDKATKAIGTALAISNIASAEARIDTLKMESSAKRDMLFSFIIIVSTIIVFIFFIWWSINLILKPILILTGITQEITQGNFLRRAKYKSKNEIGVLFDNFYRMSEDLIKAKNDWQSTFDSIGDIITLHDKDNRLIGFNMALTSALNIKPEYNAAKKYYELTNEEYDALFGDPVKEAFQSKSLSTIEVEKPDIDTIFSISRFPRFNNNEFIGVVRIMSDITERKHLYSKLKREKQYKDNLINTAQDSIVSTDEKGIISVWNIAAEKLFGYLKHEIIGQPVTTIIPERYKKQHQNGIERFIRGGESKIIGKSVEIFGRTKEGIEIPIEMSLSYQKIVKEGYYFTAIIRDITERKKWENEIHKLSSAIEQSPVSVVITDTKGNIEYVNKKFTQITGYTYEESIGKNPRILKTNEKSSEEYKELWETITSGNEWRGEFSNKNKNGEIYWESASVSSIKNNDGVITHFIAVKEDISARKQMEMSRKQVVLRMEEINKLQQFLLSQHNMEAKLKKITETVVKLFDADFCRIWIIKPGDRCDAGCIHAAVAEGTHACQYPDRCLHLLSSSGRYTHIDGDVHGRVPFGCYKIGLLAAAKNHKILTNDVIHDQRIHDQEWASKLGLVSFAGYQLKPLFGKTIGVLALFSKHTISPDEDSLLEMIGYSTAQVIQSSRVENELSDSNEKLELLFSSIPSGIIEITNDCKISRLNTSAENIFGTSTSDVIGRPLHECNIPWDMDEIIKKVSLCKETESSVWTDSLKYKRIDGNKGLLNVTINPIINDEDKQTGQLILVNDITEHKNMEYQLVQAQKLESIGQLAAGIAHEINTPTQFISDNTLFTQNAFSKIATLLKKYSYLLEMNRAGSVTPEMISEIDVAKKDINFEYLIEEIPVAIKESQEGLNRVAEIVQSMKTFSHPGIEEKVFIDINAMIKSTIAVSRNEWKYVADVETDFDSGLPPVPCFPGEFNQVILNLIVNAAHAIEVVSGNGGVDKGKITISTSSDGDWAEIRISDTGTGIPEKIRSRLFEPFFTTKDVGKGTGQGLTIAHSVIVKKHNGTITFDTEMGKGTTFVIRLPIVA